MNKTKKEQTKEKLAKQLKNQIEIILEEYGEVIPTETIIKLKKIKDYKELIEIKDTKTISCFVRDDKIYFPETIEKILKMLKFIPGNSINKNHKAYKKENLVLNKNTFITYMKHLFIKGATPEEFYEENLLHETMHLCGSKGVFPLHEGLTEYKTRKIAQKHNLKTTGCGYPKEVKIVETLTQILGEEFMNIYSFEK